MATKNLKSITFPGLPDKYTVVQPDGYYEDLTSGSTEEVISNVKITDQEPYTFRTSGGNAEIASREEDTLVGVSVAFNQLVYRYTISQTKYGLTFVNNDEKSITVTGTLDSLPPYGQLVLTQSNSRTPFYRNGRKYLITISKPLPYNSGISGFAPVILAGKTSGMWTDNQGGAWSGAFACTLTNSNIGDTIDIQNVSVNITDLTLAFGSDIADYLYTLEQAQAGEGVALAKKLGLNKYLGYNAGTLYSAQTDAHKMTGFNQFNKDASYVKGNNYRYVDVPIGATHELYMTFKDKDTSVNLQGIYVGFSLYNPEGAGSPYRWVMENGTIGTNHSNRAVYSGGNGELCPYVMIYPNTADAWDRLNRRYDINVSIHWDNSRDTDYEPYVLHNYPIDPVVLRGILKKDADGNIYADGDTYEADGTVTRRYGVVDLGSLTWTYNTTDASAPFFTANIGDGVSTRSPNYICDKYAWINNSRDGLLNAPDKSLACWNTTNSAQVICIKDSAYTDTATFKTAVSGVMLVYELKKPTTEQATPFTTPQIVDNWGTEEYPDYAVAQGDREYSVPMGHITLYPISIRDKVEASADNPSNDGVYILQISGGKATYIPLIIEDELPTMPTQDGTYSLKTVVSSGTATLSWVAE